MMTMMASTVIQKINTTLNADAVEWCPFINRKEFLLCGTYKLKESTEMSLSHAVEDQPTEDQGELESPSPVQPQVRDGAVLVYKLNEDLSQPWLMPFASLDMCGVLDIKWPISPMKDKAVFGLVNAEGFVQLLNLDEENQTVLPIAEQNLTESSLGLSLDWSQSSNNSQVAASDSAGCVTVFDGSDGLTLIETWKAHDYEAWITAFHGTDHNIVFSGGDDCKLKRWDLRDTCNPTMTSRRHQMGVCSIQSHPSKDNIFASGSYDEELLVWDDRHLKQPMTSTSLGGGVWRIKWEPHHGSQILTATMYNGSHIVDCTDLGVEKLPIVADYKDHNLAYGADWCRASLTQTQESPSGNELCDLIATCSFYDHALHLWKWEKMKS